MKTLGFVLLAVVAICGSVSAQSIPSEYTPVWGNEQISEAGSVYPYSLIWSADSQTLYFTASNASSLLHFQYDTHAEVYTSSSIALPTVQLSEEQQAHFQAKDAEAFLAPDGDTFLYVSEAEAFSLGEGGYRSQLFGVGSLDSQTFLPTRIRVFAVDRIRWSDDSSAFVVQHSTPYGTSEAISYARSTNTTCSWKFCEFQEIFLASIFSPETIYDISPDGLRVLRPDLERELMLWDATQSIDYRDSVALPLENVAGAAFSNDDSEIIFVVNENGVVRYNLINHQMEVIDRSTTSDWASWATFSPDNRWIAVLSGEYISELQLFVVPLQAEG